ncbi:MAG TPA: cytochrome P450 [Chloroflexia bacterium]|nr:cytochrome P450 [Chloroflexia bacterium]
MKPESQSTSPNKPPHRKPHGPYAFPLVGALYTYLENPLDFAMKQYRRFGEVVGVDIMGIRGAVLHGPEANRYILVDAVDNFLVAPLIDKVHARWIVGDGLLFIDDPRHKRERRLVMPAFHRKRIEEYQTVMRDTTKEVLDTWRPGKLLNIAHEMHRVALIVVGRTLFDMELGGDAHELGDAVATVVATVGNPFNIALGH